MKKRSLFLIIGSLTILASMLACSIPVSPTATATDEGPGPVTDVPALPTPLTVAYIKAGNVWLWTEAGGARQLTFTGDAVNPSVSDDGQVVAFVRNGELWAVNADGSSERVLVDSTYLSALIPPSPDGDTVGISQHVWAPGSHMVYFNTLTVAGIAGYRIPRYDLCSVNADSPSVSLVNLEAEGRGGVPSFSPDGSTLALVQPTKVIFLAVDGSFYTEAFTFPMVLTYSEWFYVPPVAWLPDSSGVRLAVPAADPLGDPTAVSTFWNVPVSGAPSVLATYVAVPAFISFQYVSPNADSVLYLVETSGMTQVHSVNSGGADTFYFWYDPNTVGLIGWAPDSVHFMFWNPDTTQTGYGSSDTNMLLGDTPTVRTLRWVDDNRYLYLNDTELRLKSMDSASVVIDSGVSEYEFVP